MHPPLSLSCYQSPTAVYLPRYGVIALSHLTTDCQGLVTSDSRKPSMITCFPARPRHVSNTPN
ncbi:hypothetical protein LX32DRAFT_376718 [Colletotrichum zoysiae]|uniref:Uncharacterized protein n=1 Tax=Colletotrichum zoysiae TaxID=1216348 RepID=A0AAD9HJR7_9PEZI|nr:hypothetical protein LX32DRAFT_376718 [Colletotrichum zoysiae]